MCRRLEILLLCPDLILKFYHCHGLVQKSHYKRYVIPMSNRSMSLAGYTSLEFSKEFLHFFFFLIYKTTYEVQVAVNFAQVSKSGPASFQKFFTEFVKSCVLCSSLPGLFGVKYSLTQRRLLTNSFLTQEHQLIELIRNLCKRSNHQCSNNLK